MTVEQFSEVEQEIIFACLKCVLNSPFIFDFEFRARTCNDREYLSELVSHWPNVDYKGEGVIARRVVRCCLVEVCYGITFSKDEWKTWIDYPKEAVKAVAEKWIRIVPFC
jgi:hypothetical protein